MMILLELSYSSRPSMNQFRLLGFQGWDLRIKTWTVYLWTQMQIQLDCYKSLQKFRQLTGKHLKIEFSRDCVHPAALTRKVSASRVSCRFKHNGGWALSLPTRYIVCQWRHLAREPLDMLPQWAAWDENTLHYIPTIRVCFYLFYIPI